MNAIAEPRPTKRPLPQPLEAVNHPDALLRLQTVIALTGMSSATIYRRIAAGQFPQPKRNGLRFSRFRAGDVTAWLQAQ